MLETLRSYGHLRAIDATAMTVEAVISTGNVGRDQTVIDPAGWDFSNYRKNPVVLWSHNDFAVPVARTIGEVQTGPNELRATAEFDREDPEAVRLFGKVKRGYVNATSVRWLPKRTEIRALPIEGGGERDTIVFVEQELLEWSFVAIPADPGAVILRSDGSGVDVDAMLRDLRKGEELPMIALLTPQLLDLISGDLDDEARAALRTLQAHITSVLTEPVIAGQRDDRVLVGIEQVTAAIRTLTAMKPPDAEALVVSAVARHTGKTEERVRAELAGGNE